MWTRLKKGRRTKSDKGMSTGKLRQDPVQAYAGTAYQAVKAEGRIPLNEPLSF